MKQNNHSIGTIDKIVLNLTQVNQPDKLKDVACDLLELQKLMGQQSITNLPFENISNTYKNVMKQPTNKII